MSIMPHPSDLPPFDTIPRPSSIFDPPASVEPDEAAAVSPVEVFRYQDRQVRTVLVDDQPWFVAADACAVLGIGRPQDSVRYLDSDERGRCRVDTPGGEQEVLTVSEPGLFSLIMRSRKPEARAFTRWVTHEVLPAIRRTGAYAVPVERTAQPAVELSRRDLALMVVESEDRAREADEARRRAEWQSAERAAVADRQRKDTIAALCVMQAQVANALSTLGVRTAPQMPFSTGATLRELIQEQMGVHRLTYAEMARRSGGRLTRSRWQQLGTGTRMTQFPDPATLETIAEVLRVEVAAVVLAAGQTVGLTPYGAPSPLQIPGGPWVGHLS